MFMLLLMATFVAAQERNELTVIRDSAYHIGTHAVTVTVIAVNPYMDQFASHPEVRITLRGSDGSVIATRSVSSAGIPPRGQIVFCGKVYFDERPVSVEIQPLRAGYEAALFPPTAFKEFKVINLKFREGPFNRVTGELLNPYPADTGAWVTLLFRNAAGKLIGGVSHYLSDVSVGATPFEIPLNDDEIPRGVAKTEWSAFNHINSQYNYRKLIIDP